mmetsp:Transcript_62533/g.176382  ORF Transcript_62533/g.176382 Transcript_62533/m.176382 type:complete len:477 (-) Transcript_62533:298-1728(-)
MAPPPPMSSDVSGLNMIGRALSFLFREAQRLSRKSMRSYSATTSVSLAPASSRGGCPTGVASRTPSSSRSLLESSWSACSSCSSFSDGAHDLLRSSVVSVAVLRASASSCLTALSSFAACRSYWTDRSRASRSFSISASRPVRSVPISASCDSCSLESSWPRDSACSSAAAALAAKSLTSWTRPMLAISMSEMRISAAVTICSADSLTARFCSSAAERDLRSCLISSSRAVWRSSTALRMAASLWATTKRRSSHCELAAASCSCRSATLFRAASFLDRSFATCCLSALRSALARSNSSATAPVSAAGSAPAASAPAAASPAPGCGSSLAASSASSSAQPAKSSSPEGSPSDQMSNCSAPAGAAPGALPGVSAAGEAWEPAAARSSEAPSVPSPVAATRAMPSSIFFRICFSIGTGTSSSSHSLHPCNVDFSIASLSGCTKAKVPGRAMSSSHLSTSHLMRCCSWSGSAPRAAAGTS